MRRLIPGRVKLRSGRILDIFWSDRRGDCLCLRHLRHWKEGASFARGACRQCVLASHGAHLVGFERKVVRTEWRAGIDTTGIVLTFDETTKEYAAYIGGVHQEGGVTGTKADAQRIADYGARLTRKEAQPFFPDIDLSVYKDEI